MQQICKITMLYARSPHGSVVFAFHTVFFITMISQKIQRKLTDAEILSHCRGFLIRLSFVSPGTAKRSHQDENHSGSRPHSFSGCCYTLLGTSPQFFWSNFEVAGSWESPLDGLVRIKCGFPSTTLLAQLLRDSTLNFHGNLGHVVFL